MNAEQNDALSHPVNSADSADANLAAAGEATANETSNVTATSNLTATSTVEPLRPPVAKREPSLREFHGERFVDPYEWMRDKESPELQAYVAAQNKYTDARMEHLAGLRKTLFDEFKSHIKETDMSVPTRVDGYWYFGRTYEGKQYGVQCRIPVHNPDDWDAPEIGERPSAQEQVVFDMNKEAEGHDFCRLGGMDISTDGKWMLYGLDTAGDERYTFRIRNLETGEELPEVFENIAGACFTPKADYVFYTLLDDAWRPYAIVRHKVGTPVSEDVEVFREEDERFFVGVGLSFDERLVVIGTNSKTTTEVLMLPVDTPEGKFEAFIPRKEGIEYDVSFSTFEGAGENGTDLPVAVVYHNANNPNFEIDVIDMRAKQPPYQLGEGVCVFAGSPYGCEQGDIVEPGASQKPVGTPYTDPRNPVLTHGATGLAVEGIGIHKHFVMISYRSNALPHLAIMSKKDAAEDFLAGRPWRFEELLPPALADDWDSTGSTVQHREKAVSTSTATGTADHNLTANANSVENADVQVPVPQSEEETGSSEPVLAEAGNESSVIGVPECLRALDCTTARLYSIGAGGNPSYEAPCLRYSFGSFARPSELHEYNPLTGEDKLLKRAQVMGDFDAREYVERRVWVQARDGERIPVSLVSRRGVRMRDMPMFITSYGAYEISSDPGFSVARLSMLDRGVLYAVPHIRGGGEMGRAWYEQGRRLNKMHTFEDFVDVTEALQECGLADPKRTVADGGSAGGLLMGAVANLAPERFAGIEADVPFVDALTSILDPSLPLTVTEWDEWGDPLHNPEVYTYMAGYSPYENAPEGAELAEEEAVSGAEDGAERGTVGEAGPGVWPDGTPVKAFPKILVTTSMNDTRVLYVEPLKWTARLQSAGVDAMVKIEVEAGHGGTSGRYKQWEEVCYENAWCLDVMKATKLQAE